MTTEAQQAEPDRPHEEPDAATGVAGRRAQRRGRSPLIVAAFALLGFTIILILVVLGNTTAFDLRVTLGWQRVQLPGLLPLMQAISWLGFKPQVTYLGVGMLILLIALRLRLEAFFVFLAFLVGMLSGPIKVLIERPRPVAAEGLIVQFPAGGYSFPSGHVMTYVLVSGFLAYLAYTLIRWRPLRWGLLTLLLGPVALVGPSRVYLGQHWATDTLASYFLGTALLLLLILLYRAAKARQLAATL